MSAFKQKIVRLGVRAGLLAGASAAVLAISGIGVSSAAAVEPECPSNAVANIQGKGSSLQRVGQEQWTGRKVPSGEPVEGLPHEALGTATGYRVKCATTPTVSYTSTSSGSGLKAFGFNGSGSVETLMDYVGSDDGPNATQIANAESAAATTGTGAKPLIIPVAETSIAVVIHPPKHCKFEAEKGLTYGNLNAIFGGKEIKNWNEIANIEATEAGACSHPITRVVRADSSGTTVQFKNYLATLQGEGRGVGMPCALPGIEEPSGTAVSTTEWKNMKFVGANGEPNTVWPKPSNCAETTTVVAKEGGGGVAAYVASAEGEDSIGYAALPDAKGKEAEVARLQDQVTLGVKYALPNGATGETANCAERQYEVPLGSRVGESGVAGNWSQVFGAKSTVGGGKYPLCTLTYDIAWKTYAGAGYTNGAAVAADVKDYIRRYLLEAGQSIGHWYQALPSATEAKNNVLGAAVLAAEEIS